MKSYSLVFSLLVAIPTLAFSQSGANGPMVTDPVPATAVANQHSFQQELEKENAERLLGEEYLLYLEELEEMGSGAAELQPDLDDQASVGYLHTQADQLATRIRLVLDEQMLVMGGEDAETLPALDQWEQNSIHGDLTVLTVQMATIMNGYETFADDSFLLVTESTEEYEASLWLLEAERGFIR